MKKSLDGAATAMGLENPRVYERIRANGFDCSESCVTAVAKILVGTSS